MTMRPEALAGQDVAAPAGEAQAPALLTTPARLRKQRLWSGAFLCVWLALAIWTAFILATAWPYTTSRTFFGLVIALPGLVFRGFDLAYMQLRQRRLAGWWRSLARLAAVPVGLMLAPFDQLDRMSMARFEATLAPLIAQIQANATAPCPPAVAYTKSPALQDYINEAQEARRPGKLHHVGGRTIFELSGGSADFDGSTIYYDSQTRIWQKFHNDTRDKADAFAALVKDMESCKIELR